MRISVTLLPLAAILAVSCGPRTLELSAEPVERAATCGVVAAANARKAAGVGDLPFTEQGRIMHYALLSATEGESFSEERMAAVMARMSEIEERVRKGKWEELIAPCQQAFPETAAERPITLPENAFRSQLACYMLADTLLGGLHRQAATYGPQILRFSNLRRELDQRVGTGLARRGAGDREEAQPERGAALKEAARLGSPMLVISACADRYLDEGDGPV